MAIFVDRISGADRSTWTKGQVAGTDLGIPYRLENGSIGYLFGDSFTNQQAGGPGWRSPVGFRSAQNPTNQTITFDSAYGVPASGGYAPDLCINQKSNNDWNAFGQEYTVIPNDAVSFTATGRHVMSFMSINRWRNDNAGGPGVSNLAGVPGAWRTNYNALAWTDNGNNFTRLGGDGNNTVWWNNEQNSSPFQMMTFADGMDGFVYAYSVRAGRQTTPFMLQRVPWNQMFSKSSWQGWNNNGGTWHWGGPDECTSLFPQKMFGEPSVRRLYDGTWAMSYLTSGGFFDGGPKIVTRTSPNGINWSAEKTQVTFPQEPNLYGGFIHPMSLPGTNKLTLIVSKWVFNTPTYDSRQYRGTL